MVMYPWSRQPAETVFVLCRDRGGIGRPMVVAAEAAAAGMQTHSTAASRKAAARRQKECRCFKVRFLLVGIIYV